MITTTKEPSSYSLSMLCYICVASSILLSTRVSGEEFADFATDSSQISLVVEPFEPKLDISSLSVTGNSLLTLSKAEEAAIGGGSLEVGLDAGETNETVVEGTFQWVLRPEETMYHCMGASHISLWYKTLEPTDLDDLESREGTTWSLQLSALRAPPGCFPNEGCDTVSEYRSAEISLGASNDDWSEIRIPFEDIASPSALLPPFSANRIRGWRFTLRKVQLNANETSSEVDTGTLLLDHLACVGDGKLLDSVFRAVDTFEEALDRNLLDLDVHESPLATNKTQLSIQDGKLDFNYTVEQRESWGGHTGLDHVLPKNAYYNLSQAQHVSFRYSVNEVASTAGRVHCRLVLLETSSCVANCTEHETNEVYYSFQNILDAEASLAFANIPLEGSSDFSSPFVRPGWIGIVGNDIFDKDQIKGISVQMSMGSQGLIGSVVDGSFSVDGIYAGVATSSEDDSSTTMVRDYMVNFLPHAAGDNFRLVEFFAGECEETCAEDSECLYASLHKAHCYHFTSLLPEDVQLIDSAFDTDVSFWKRTADDFCEVCVCDAETRTIDCRNKNLVALPTTVSLSDFQPRVLDLSKNPNLIFIGEGALTAIASSLQELVLPSNIRFAAESLMHDLTSLVSLQTEQSGIPAELRKSNVLTNENELFGNICCALGDRFTLASGDVTYCAMGKDTVGVDSVYEPFWHYNGGAPIVELRSSSPFMAEAAESPEKCAEYCSLSSECRAFQHDRRVTLSDPYCQLFRNLGSDANYACCDPTDFSDANLTMPGWTSGIPPRARHSVENARVIISHTSLKLSNENSYQGEYSVSLGSNPLRGAVWVLPKLVNGQVDVTFSPERVALYSNDTAVKITFKVDPRQGVPGDTETLVIVNVVQSCDAAFVNEFGATGSETDIFVTLSIKRSRKAHTATVVASVIAVVAVMLSVVSSMLFRHKRRIQDSAWKIDIKELHFGDPPEIIGNGGFGSVYLAEYRGTQVAVKRLTLRPNGSNTSINRSIVSKLEGGSYRKNTRRSYVSETSTNFSKPTQERDDFLQEMKLLSKLRHPCITTVMGAVTGRHLEPMLVMEYMEYGSLYNVLHNDTFLLDGDILQPILMDITQGVRFLHAAKPQVTHGDLKAHNILVDGRFRAKVADFGLSHKQRRTGTPYWMAPELLRGEAINNPATDVYSFGVILYEIYARKEPYEDDSDSNLMESITCPELSKRPTMPPNCPAIIKSMAEECYFDDPALRPTFEDLDIRFRAMQPSSVEPLGSKKRKADSDKLLHEVFPRHVADALREGKMVEPESRDCVTIFFSDIVSFTEISSTLTPLQVSNMLHRLYSKLDQLSREYSVMKVETIGDAYMAVTNLAEQQPDHVHRMLNFAAAALDAANQVPVDDTDPTKGFIRMRIGLHSGPVVASVVGSRNPRYCLFGDSVNIAARMESSSQPGRIHCSDASADLLIDQLFPCNIVPRGEIPVKGKGVMQTYWVSPEEEETARVGSSDSSTAENSSQIF